MSTGRFNTLSLYKTMLRESEKFQSYYYRSYVQRKIRDEFRLNKTVEDPNKLDVLTKKAQENLEIIKRQVIVNRLYKGNELVIEQQTIGLKPPIKTW